MVSVDYCQDVIFAGSYNVRMAIMDIQISPRKPGTISVSVAVAEAHRVIQQSGLVHLLTPMGTCIEGEPAQLYELAAEIHAMLIEMDYPRIGVYIKIDDRRDKPQRMDDKLKSVEDKLAKE